MTFYNLPGVDAKIEFDKDTKVLQITNLKESDAVVVGCDNRDYSQSVRIKLS